MHEYVRVKVPQTRLPSLTIPTLPLLYLSLYVMLPDERKPTLLVKYKMASTLLEHGADPNGSFRESSFWQKVLESTLSASDEEIILWDNTLEDYIFRHADICQTVTLSASRNIKALTPEDVIESAFIDRANSIKIRERRRQCTATDSSNLIPDTTSIKTTGLRLKSLVQDAQANSPRSGSEGIAKRDLSSQHQTKNQSCTRSHSMVRLTNHIRTWARLSKSVRGA